MSDNGYSDEKFRLIGEETGFRCSFAETTCACGKESGSSATGKEYKIKEIDAFWSANSNDFFHVGGVQMRLAENLYGVR
jgi:hypothetical protein